MYLGFIVIFVGGLISFGMENKELEFVIWIGVAIMAAGILLHNFIKCPNCRSTIGNMLVDSYIKLDNKIKSCPYCSIEFDENIKP